ncbi:MAG: carbohydrate kinase family protein [Candidatus Paceibacterota bacterium]
MFQLLTVGNITVDLYFKGKTLPMKDKLFQLACGSKYIAEEFHEGLGGGAANVAIGASNQGLNCAVLAKVGENVFKQIVLQKLVNKRISTEFLIYDRKFKNISSIFLSPGGERSLVHFTTPHTSFDLSDLQKQSMLKYSSIYFSHLSGVSFEEKLSLVSFFKKNGKRILLNIGIDDARLPKRKIHAYIQHADTLILNRREFATLVGKQPARLNLEKNVAEYIKFKEKLLVITDGSHGSFAYQEGKVYIQKSSNLKTIIDCTGAGDAYTSGFLAAYLKDNMIQDCMKAGTEYSAKILSRLGANA